MSYSQKHSGKVFIPWYNTAEWKSIYSRLTVKTIDSNKDVLEIMKTWKIRTPLLSAGIEGTIIILEALLCDELFSSETQIIQTYALSLLRFLNICAGNNEKQGTFNKTVTKNDLPKWIIDIRHDIAHDHRLPSKYMLKLALEESLDWLMDKYWAVQNQKLSDFIVENEETDPLHMYMDMKVGLFKDVDMDQYHEACLQKLNNLISKKRKNVKSDINGILNSLEQLLKQSFALSDRQIMGTKVAQILTSRNGLLSTNLEKTDDNVEVIPQDFREIWSDLLNIIFENNLLFFLLNKLLEVTNNSELDNTLRKIASLWIIEIFNGISRLQLEGSRNIPKQLYENLKLFEENILLMPNEYTGLFLESVMRFNKNSQEYIDNVKDLVDSLISPKCPLYGLEHAFTTDDFYFYTDHKRPPYTTVEDKVGTSRWKVIKGTSIFEGSPLGILPFQNRDENPVLYLST